MAKVMTKAKAKPAMKKVKAMTKTKVKPTMNKAKIKDESPYNWDAALEVCSLHFGKNAIIGIICEIDPQTEKPNPIERFVAVKEADPKNPKKKKWVKKFTFGVDEKNMDSKLQVYGKPYSFANAYGYFRADEPLEKALKEAAKDFFFE